MEIKKVVLRQAQDNPERIRRVAIIGAGGEMGGWFAEFFAKEGVEVFAADRDRKKLSRLKKMANVHPVKLPSALFNRVNLAKDNKEAIKSADLILVSVLLKDFKEAIKEIAAGVKENQIVIDILSLKEEPVRVMHRFLNKNLILGTHPLFGPGAEIGAEKQNFFLTPTNDKEKILARDFGKWLKRKGFNVVETSPEEHDRLMATILGLPHFIGLAVGSTLAKFNVRKLKEVAGPSFKKLFELVQGVASSSPDFYSELHLNLPKINELENIFEKEIKAWREMIKNKNQEKFIAKMLKTKNAVKDK